MSSLEEARSSLTKYSRTNRHKRSSKHRSEAMSVDGVNGFLSGQLLSKRKKRKRRLSEWDPWSVKEALVQLKKGESAVQELIVSIRLDTGVTVSQYCHKELSHGSGNVLGSEAIDIIDITRSSDESLVDEVLPNRSDAVHSTASGMNGFHRGYGSSKSNRDLPSAQSDSSCNHPPLVSAKHRLSCLKHDHPYSKQLCSKTLPSILPSILTSPTSAEPCEELSFSTQTTDVGNVTISPPPTPVDNSQHSSRIDRYFELHSPQPQAMNDYPQSNSPIPPSPLSTAFKLQWSSASSVSSDFEVCNEVSPLTTKPGQETKDRLHLTTYRGRKLYKPSRMSLNSGWRKGPVPLPRSFSKRHSSASLLQTKAAKQKSVPSASYQSNDLDSKSYLNDSEIKIKKFSLSLKRGFERIKSKKLMNALAPFIANDENHFDQVFPSEDIESVDSHARSDRDSLEYTSLCTYKELLMDWQYELNKQRDGTDDIIYVENNLDMTAPPTDFNYVCSNVYAAGVPNPSNPDLSSSLCGCECYYLGRKCGPKSEFCCAHMAGSRFAYTPAGKVKVPPGTPIYECNTKCSCPSDCSNRIVQLGRKIPLCIFRAEGRGWGVKTTEPIKPNTFVTEYVGEVITNEEAEKRGKKCDAQGITYLFDLDFEDDNSAFTVDAARYGNISHFFNHSVSPHACSGIPARYLLLWAERKLTRGAWLAFSSLTIT